MELSGRYSSYLQQHLPVLAECRICPHQCAVNRLAGKKGVCRSDADFHISSICIHKGEEPVISGENGICNLFFSRCNLSCVYCQNWQISCQKGEALETIMSLEQVIDTIIPLLDRGCRSVGFVSPTHYIPHVKAIIDALRSVNRNPVFIYNTNCYDLDSEIRGLEGYIDVYLPDLKYADAGLAKELSAVNGYPETAMKALKEMYRQKGSTLIMDEDGQIEKGLIIRHLILPGYVENSKQVLQLIAGQLSESVAISLMAQYWPTPNVQEHPPLNRSLSQAEYELVVDELEKLGFYKGWVQDLESRDHYLPDFRNFHPFQEK